MSDSKKALQQHVNDLTQERDVLLEKCKQSEEAYAVLMHQLKEMLRHRFGQKKVINHAVHERLNYLPPVYEVIIERRQTEAHPSKSQVHCVGISTHYCE